MLKFFKKKTKIQKLKDKYKTLVYNLALTYSANKEVDVQDIKIESRSILDNKCTNKSI
jgi:hypothetical protein